MENNKDLQSDFAWALYQRYFRHCDQHEKRGGFQDFTKYLIDCGVIKQRTIQRFMIAELYPRALAACGGKKLEAISMLAEQTGLSERTVRRMVAYPERYAVK